MSKFAERPHCPQCGAKPPYKSLQIRPEDVESGAASAAEVDGIRMTMYYYYKPEGASDYSSNYSGHFAYDYKEKDKVGLFGIEGGPNWPMTENMANATCE